MNNVDFHQLLRYIEKKKVENRQLRPRTCLNHLRDTFPNVVIHYNRFKKKFILVDSSTVSELPVQLPLTLTQFVRVLLKTTYLQMAASKITTVPIQISDLAQEILGATMRIDAFNKIPIQSTVDVTAEKTDSDNVCRIYEEAAAEIYDLVNNLGDDDEKQIFNATFSDIVTPHIQRQYVDIDRNAKNREAHLTGNFSKMQAGLYCQRNALPTEVWFPAFALSLNKHVPRDVDGYPMEIDPPKDMANLETLLTSAIKNTSAGTSFRDYNDGATKQQLIKDSALMAQNILHQLADDNDVVPIVSNTISDKTENIKRSKSGRYFFMESIVYNIINQIVFGHIIDNQHQIPLTTFFNGLSAEYGIGRYTMERMLNGLDMSIEDLEKYVQSCLANGYGIEQISEDLTSLIMTSTYDYTNFEFYHHVMVAMIDFFSTSYYYTPGPDDHMFRKTNAYIFENVAIIEIHVGNGVVIRAAPAAMASGQFRTLVGNSGRNDAYVDVGVIYNIYKKQTPPEEKEKRLFLNSMKNSNKQGDDGFGIFLSRHIDHVLHFFENVHNYCYVKIKPEIRRLISNHTEKFCNIMTNSSGDFLKYCVGFNYQTGQLAFTRPFQSFLLRMISPNNNNLEPAKILQTSRSFALNSGLCPMATLYAKKLFDKTFEYLKMRKMLTPGTSDKELFVDSLVVTYDLNADVSLSEADLAKESFKKINNPNEQTTPNNVVSFPSQDEINSRVATDIHLISKLVNADNYYAVHRLNYQIALRYFEQSADGILKKPI